MVEYISPISTILMKLMSFVEEDIRICICAKREMKKLKIELEIIEPFIEAAERRQLGTDKALQVWLRNLKHIFYNIEDAVDEWNARILKMNMEHQNASKLKKVLLCILYPFRRVGLYAKISRRIKARKEELDKIDEQTRRYTTHLQPIRALQNNQLDQAETTPNKSNTVVPVREREKDQLITMLLAENTQLAAPVVSIIGKGGIGKSTLAKEAYHDCRVVQGAFEKMVWVWVSKHFDIARIAKEIVEAIEGQTPQVTGLTPLLEKLKNCVKGKKVLIVLDNIWIERRHNNETPIRNTNDTRSLVQLRSDTDHWLQLKDSLTSAASISKILITTRSREVAEDLGIEATKRLLLDPLSNHESEKLFEAIAFDGGRTITEELRTIGKNITLKCKGLPLAINCLAKLCRSRPDSDWKRILESAMWRQEEVEKEVFRPLMISYCYLEPSIRRCLLYCAIFPKGSILREGKLIKLWMAQGFLQPRGFRTMEAVGSGYFNYLEAHHFFQYTFSGAKMHDIIHDFITYLSVEVEGYFTSEEKSTNDLTVEGQERVRHYPLLLKYDETPPAQICDFKRLRSLIVKWSHGSYHLDRIMKWSHESYHRVTPDIEKECNAILHKAFDKLGRLRVLSLPNLPFALDAHIGKLILLSYLDLSRNPLLSELPEGICDLINLQTLDISECRSLEKLPDRIGDLTNLIHLLNQGTKELKYMPKGIRRLTKLQTLSEFVVGNGENAASLEDLGYLTNLQEELEIRVLSNVDEKQAKTPMGKASGNIVSLILRFGNSPTDESVLKVFKVPESLQELHILGYGGRSLSQLSLSKTLKKVFFCSMRLEQLPPLGQLQTLEELRLDNLPEVRKIGVEVLGIEGEGNQEFIAFPRLQFLRIVDLQGWEEWDFEIPNTSNNSSRTISIMPCLRFLEIDRCYSITSERVPPQILGLESLEAFQLNGTYIRRNDRSKGKSVLALWVQSRA